MDGAFHALDTQPNRLDLTDIPRRESLSKIQPEDGSVALSNDTRNDRPKRIFYFPELHGPLDLRLSSRLTHVRFNRLRIVRRDQDGTSALKRFLRAQVVAGHICCHYFQISDDGIWFSCNEVSQKAAVVHAQLKQHFLNQVLDACR